MIIALFPNILKPHSKNAALRVSQFLSQKGVSVVFEDEVAHELKGKSLKEMDLSSIDFSITFGGDGTILRMVHRHPEIEAPVFGINLGSLGFLADIPEEEIKSGLEDLLSGKYRVVERMVLEATSDTHAPSFAVNDIVIHRGNVSSLIDLAIHVDGNYLNTFSADGVIIATPSGSTAYSMSAGGPILSPELDSIVLTPICPHTLSNRPIVLKPKQEILIEYISNYPPIEITYDGLTPYHLKTKENLKIAISPTRTFKLIALNRHDYYATLRTKLGWSGKLRLQSNTLNNP